MVGPAGEEALEENRQERRQEHCVAPINQASKQGTKAPL